MSALSRGVEEDELHARIDGCLPPGRAAEIDAYLDAHPEAQARLQQYAEQRRGLRAAFAAHGAEPIPARLRIIPLLAERRRRNRQRLARAAAVGGLIVLGGLGGWFARDTTNALWSSTSNAEAAVAARNTTAAAIEAYRVYSVEIRHPVEVAAAQEAHLVQWLSKRLGRPLVVPDLGAVGFRLMGGRLLPGTEGPAAQLMYEDAKGTRLTCYFLAVGFGGETAFRYSNENGIGAFYWSDAGFGYAITAKANRALLLKAAEIIYRQTEEEGDRAKIPPKPGKAS
jgi:anti-sigma factor RsiW